MGEAEASVFKAGDGLAAETADSLCSACLASGWGPVWPGACLSARGLGFRVNVPTWGSQRIECRAG